jgi:hypothetical protein
MTTIDEMPDPRLLKTVKNMDDRSKRHGRNVISLDAKVNVMLSFLCFLFFVIQLGVTLALAIAATIYMQQFYATPGDGWSITITALAWTAFGSVVVIGFVFLIATMVHIKKMCCGFKAEVREREEREVGTHYKKVYDDNDSDVIEEEVVEEEDYDD